MTRRKWMARGLSLFLAASLMLQAISMVSGAGGLDGGRTRGAGEEASHLIYVPLALRESILPEALRPGDILTRDSTWISFMPAHDALYAGDGLIIDSTDQGGVQYRSLAGFIADADDYVVAHRLKDWSEEVAQGALQYAIAHIGTPYDFNFFGGKDTEDKMYCSELVWRSYLSQGFDLDSDPFPWVWPSDIVHSPLLVEVNAGLSPGGS
jgi:cell wall-associated NlpC family hydrolase